MLLVPSDADVFVVLLLVKDVYVLEKKFSISANVLLLANEGHALLSFASVLLSTPYPSITCKENVALEDGMAVMMTDVEGSLVAK